MIPDITNPKTAIEHVTRRMFSMRKRAEVARRPYTPCPGYNPAWPSFYFSKVLPDMKQGETAYAAAILPGPFERDLVISVTGDTVLSFNGEEPAGYENRGMLSYPVHFREGENLLILRHRTNNEKMGFEIYIGPENMPVYWPGGYIYKTNPVIPLPDFCGMEGFAYSRAYRPEEALPPLDMAAISWAGPTLPPAPERTDFDFAARTSCNTASTVSWGRGDICLGHNGPVTVFADDRQVYQAESGCFTMRAEREIPLYVVAERSGSGFGFWVESGSFRLPFYDTPHEDLHWLWLEDVRLSGQPLQFKTPYRQLGGGETFYRFYRDNTYLRLYLNTAFFGQWFYAIMVGHYGVLKMAERLGLTEYIEYFRDSITILEDYYEYALFDHERSGISSLQALCVRLNDLDSIGTFGMNAAELVRLTEGAHGRRLMERLEQALSNVPRLENGTFYRIKTFWTDDFFMSVPFLARLAAIGGRPAYFAEAARQVRGFSDYLYMEKEQIYSHIYFVEAQKPNRIPWGRGNGWVMFALSELLLLMPKSHPDYPEMLSRFQALSQGILRYQGKNGMWHQVIDDEETYEEMSGTGMFIIALTRGVKAGWLSRDIVPAIRRAWERMASTCLSDEGDLLAVCIGSGCHMEREYYKKLGACINDDHGTGVFLLAATEMLDL